MIHLAAVARNLRMAAAGLAGEPGPGMYPGSLPRVPSWVTECRRDRQIVAGFASHILATHSLPSRGKAERGAEG